MFLFDFHHHQPGEKSGIYNLDLGENAVDGFFSAGIHPKDAEKVTDADFEWLQKTVALPNCRAIGECGLDGLIDINEKKQTDIFEKQIEIANFLHKPLIIHCVRRFSQMLHHRKQAQVSMIIHGFNKNRNTGNELIKYGFYLSVGKSVLHNVLLQKFIAEIPDERLLLETDDSDVPIEDIYQKTAEIKGIEIRNLQKIIQNNLETLSILPEK